MHIRFAVAFGTLALLPMFAQTNGKLAYTIPQLFGERGLTLPTGFHSAHFELGKAQESFTPFNVAVGSQIARLPLASPASGFIYTPNRALGITEQSSQTFGPVMTERAETIGRHRFYFGVSYQWFKFNSLDGIDLDSVPGILRHEQTPPHPLYEEDYITTRTSIDLKLHQITAFATFGVTDRFDLSIAVPFIDARLGVISDATIQRVSPPSPQFGQSHFFDPADREGSTFKVFSNRTSASGIGDVTFRGKVTVFRGESSALAVAADVRAPTGDEYNFLGSGAPGVRPFLAYSVSRGRIAPHFNVGYQWNGNSVLAGSVLDHRSAHLPNAFTYAAGVDLAAHRRVTLAADFLGERVFNGQAIEIRNSGADLLGRSFPDSHLHTTSFNLLTGSVGTKISVYNTFLVTANVLFRLNDSGLKANVVPLIGLSYSF